jgi:tRNA(Met) C34 N-acetyltransferase TmcA
MSPELLSVLPNLSIGVVSIGGLVYVVLQFLKALDNRADKHEKAMTEREASLRAVETDVRRFLTDQLSQNTIALQENTKVMGRVVRHLDGGK